MDAGDDVRDGFRWDDVGGNWETERARVLKVLDRLTVDCEELGSRRDGGDGFGERSGETEGIRATRVWDEGAGEGDIG